MRPASGAASALRLYKAITFWQRLCGLHAYAGLSWHTGLYLAPCNAVHTYGLRYAIDVVFLDAQHGVVGLRHALKPWRVAYCRSAVAVVELPAGYCHAFPRYHDALLDVLAPNTLS